MIWALILGCQTLWDVGNRAPVRRYAEDLVKMSTATISVDDCHMFPSSRKAYCLMSGDDSEVQTFLKAVGAKSIVPVETQVGDDHCLTLGAFATQWIPSSNLPGNSNNVHAGTLWTGVEGICFEFSYPFG